MRLAKFATHSLPRLGAAIANTERIMRLTTRFVLTLWTVFCACGAGEDGHTDPDCTVGSEGCACSTGGSCDGAMSCTSGVCTRSDSSSSENTSETTKNYARCIDCANDLCAAERKACGGDSDLLTFSVLTLQCMDECTTYSCSLGCAQEASSYRIQTKNLATCVMMKCESCSHLASGTDSGSGSNDACSRCTEACAGIPGCSCCAECGVACWN